MFRLGLRGGRDAVRVDWRFAALLGKEPSEAAFLLGAEHEYQVVAPDGERVDFRTVIHDLRLGRPRLDPDDPYSYRLPSGNAVTCDESEAEIALAPLEAEPGAASRLAVVAEREREALGRRMPSGLAMRGHSTHLSVSIPTEHGESVGRLFARSFGSDLVRLVGSPDRCGVWVRPRPDRLELCLDYVAGPRMVAVTTFSTAAARACLAAVQGHPVALPPAVRVFGLIPRHRAGWHLARGSFRGDPFATGDGASLELADGRRLSPADHLGLAWGGLRPSARVHASGAEIELVDALASAAEPAPAVDVNESLPNGGDVRDDRFAVAFGDALRARERPGYQVASVAISWSFVVFLLLRTRWPRVRQRRAFVCVPRDQLPAFLEALNAGTLDKMLRGYLSTRAKGTVLDRPEQARAPGLFDELGLRRLLLPVEPAVRRLRLAAEAMSE